MDKTKQQYLTLVFGNLVIFAATCLVTIYTALSSLKIIVKRMQDISITGNMTMVDQGKTTMQSYPISDYLVGIVTTVVGLYLVIFLFRMFFFFSKSETEKIKKDVLKTVSLILLIAFLCLWRKENFSEVPTIIYSWICLLLIKEILEMTMTEIKNLIKVESNFEQFFDFKQVRFKESDCYLAENWKQWLVPLKIEKRNLAYSMQQIIHPERQVINTWDVKSIDGWGSIKLRLKNTPFIIKLYKSPPEHIGVEGDLCGHIHTVEERGD